MSESEGLNRTDRELLISLKQDLKYLRGDMIDMKEDLGKLLDGPYSPIRDHENRLRKLENFRWYILGAVAGTAGLASFLTNLFEHIGK